MIRTDPRRDFWRWQLWRFRLGFAGLGPLAFAVLAVALVPGLAFAGDISPVSTVGQYLVQYAWLIIMLVAVALLQPLLLEVAKLLQTYRETHKTSGLLDKGLKFAQLLSRAAAAGVVQVESQLRPTIKGSGADGKLDEAEQKKCKDEAVRLGMEWLKSTVPGILADVGMDLATALGPHVDAHAAVLAGGSRTALERAGDTAPGVTLPSSPAPA